jgi:2',3'-cyclic-nucleotide 2'-phosphodiesterase/3'-nucleotidase
METTDLHVAVFPYDYYADAPNETLGLARTAALIEAIRAEAGNSILIDNGDVIQGNPMGDYIAYEKGLTNEPHPIIAAMNTLGYEAGTLGNHEFNYGLEFLDAAIAAANFPIVSANLVKGELAADVLSDTPYISPYQIVEKQLTDGSGATHTIKLGVIGFLPPQIMTWDNTHLAGKVNTRQIVEAAQAYVPKMKAEGADLIVALSHSGIAADIGIGENASLQLAAVEGIDVVVTGHQHLVFPNSKDFEGVEGADLAAGTLAGKPAVMAGFWGSHMGLIDLLLEKSEDGAWSIVSHTSEARPIFERVEGKVVPLVESVATVEAAAQADHDETLAYVRRAVGETAAPLHSYFALVADDPVGADREYRADLVPQADAQSRHRLGRPARAERRCPVQGGRPRWPGLLHRRARRSGRDQERRRSLPLSQHHPGRGHHRPGCAELARSFGRHLQPGRSRRRRRAADQPDFPSYNFDVIDGVTYKIDITKPSKYGPKGEISASPNRAASSTLCSTASRSIPAQKFVVARTTTAPAAAAPFPASAPTRSSSRAPIPTATSSSATSSRRHHRSQGRQQLVLAPIGATVTLRNGPQGAPTTSPNSRVLKSKMPATARMVSPKFRLTI